MSLLGSIFKPITDIVGGVLDKVVKDKDEAERLKFEISRAILEKGNKELEAQANIIVAEAQGTWLQRSWRPITMLIFVGLVVAKWLGFTHDDVTPEIEQELMQLIQIGLGGYVVGRSGEKIAKVWNKQ